MKKIVPVLIVLLIVIVGGVGLFLLTKDMGSEEANSETALMESPEATLEQTDATEPEETVETMTEPESSDNKTVEQTVAPQTAPVERYVTLSDYNANQSAYKDQKKVYFFHAPWCPICKAIDEDITSDVSQIPENTTFIKTDYDSNTSLRQKYGVTYQYTFVQIDNDGNELKQWSATSLDKAIAGIQ